MTINWRAPIEIRDARNGGWFWISKQVWDNKLLSASDKVTYGTLAFFANLEQIAWPSIEVLAKFSDISKRQTYRSIKVLEEVSYISVLRYKIKGKSNKYCLLKIKDDTMSPQLNKGDKSDKNRVTNSTSNNIDINKNINPDSSNRVGNENPYKKKCPNTFDGHKGCIEFITSFASSRGVKFPIMGKQINALHKMLASGLTFDDINAEIDHLEGDKFWRERGFDLMNVANEIGKGGNLGKKN